MIGKIQRGTPEAVLAGVLCMALSNQAAILEALYQLNPGNARDLNRRLNDVSEALSWLKDFDQRPISRR